MLTTTSLATAAMSNFNLSPCTESHDMPQDRDKGSSYLSVKKDLKPRTHKCIQNFVANTTIP